jgi:transposase-like protein
MAEIARDLGIKPAPLYQWRSEYLLRCDGLCASV